MRRDEYAGEQAHELDVPAVPVLYLHGYDDGCLDVALARAPRRCSRSAAASSSCPAPGTSCTSSARTR